ncbi:hypothetical protein GCM10009087_13210 [Sphingomonas oligophenolica]
MGVGGALQYPPKPQQERLGFGAGVDMRAGMHLARLEMLCPFEVFVRRIVRFQIGKIERTPHQLLRSMDRVAVRIVEAS